jgi:hypothetical protein
LLRSTIKTTTKTTSNNAMRPMPVHEYKKSIGQVPFRLVPRAEEILCIHPEGRSRPERCCKSVHLSLLTGASHHDTNCHLQRPGVLGMKNAKMHKVSIKRGCTVRKHQRQDRNRGKNIGFLGGEFRPRRHGN